MNCEQTKERIALLVYGDLDQQDADSVQQHLDECEACQHERASIISLRTLLDAAPQPVAQTDIDLAAMTTAAHPISPTRGKWHRRVLVVAAALLLVGVVLWRAEIRIDQHQLTVRWGMPTPEVPKPQMQPVAKAPAVTNHDADERIQLLNELVHALATEVNTSSQRREADNIEFQRRLAKLEEDARTYRAGAERTFAALYTAQFSNSQGD